MTLQDPMLEQLRHSPRLPEILRVLGGEMEEERQRRRKFYEEMTPEQKIEFIDGEVVLHSPARNRDLDVTKYIAKLVDTFVEINDLGTVKFEKCLVVFPRNDYEPDVVYFGNEKTAALGPDTMKFPVPDLAVEVLSKSTEERDRGVKFDDYAAGGVGEYWIVDAAKSTVEQYVLKGDYDGYELKLKSPSGILKSEVLPGFEVEIEAFFDAKKNMQALRGLVG